ncbi:DUF6286 domain-containing protein [Streptomyces coeruleoprunus]|uniref:DUF6286 domain-containing protein n=1 Tax=Streptomyces coeruleoprunus TaxID=285563 RepID=A0ABV9XMF2_9ACTN
MTTPDDAPEEAAPPVGHPAREHRFRADRRVPAALVALAVAAAAGLLLYDIASVRAGRPAMRWRRVLADELATRPLDDPWMSAGAGVAAALGVWLLVLAVTPGLRGLLPMRHGAAPVRAALARDAVALVLRDRALDVPGVRSVRVRAGRSRAAVRAVSHFRDLDDVRDDLEAALRGGIQDLGLARPPALSVRVTRPGRKG